MGIDIDHNVGDIRHPTSTYVIPISETNSVRLKLLKFIHIVLTGSENPRNSAEYHKILSLGKKINSIA
jgi:hypothetical protein